MNIFKQIETEINEFLTGKVQISEGYNYSQWDTVKRILIYQNAQYPEGNIDSEGNYKYWFDIISPRVDAEVKNIDFDTKDILLYTDPPSLADTTPLFLVNAKLRRWLRDTGQGTKINDAIEDGSDWGNVLWKKVKGGYEQLDLTNIYLINQTARTVDETAIIERHEMTQSDLRAKMGIWENIDIVIKECGRKAYTSKKESVAGGDEKEMETPSYEIYERNGEVSLANLKEMQEEKPLKGDEEKYVLAKIVVAGLTPGKKGKDEKKYVLYIKELTGKMSDIYKEYHRGRYTGRWLRKGITEILFDIQTRCLDIGNEIAQGVELALKVIFRSQKNLALENILTDLLNGHIVKSEDLQQVMIQIPGLTAAVEEWNRLMVLADKLCNSYEVVQGESLPSGTSFKLGNLMNFNASKLFDFLREKLGLALEQVIGQWIVPDLIAEMKIQDVMEIAGDREFMERYYQTIAKAWYLKNLIQIGPHTKEQADLLIEAKTKELRERPMSLVKYEREMLVGFKPKAKVVITGENLRLSQEMESWSSFITLEQDPIRRSSMIEKAMSLALPGVDIAGLPKSTPEQMAGKLNMAPAPMPQPA